jgi:hypothetical protein
MTPAPFGVCSPVHNQQVGVRVTCRQKRSDSGWCRRGKRAAQERLHVRRGRMEGYRTATMKGLRQVSQIRWSSATTGAMARNGLQQVEIRAVGTHRRRRREPTRATLRRRECGQVTKADAPIGLGA